MKKIKGILFLIPVIWPLHSIFASSITETVSGWNESIQNHISLGQNDPFTFVMLLAGGLLASLLPCVYPLYPITAEIIRRRGSGGSTYVHTLSYFFGLSFMYFVFGLIAGITGGAFNDFLHIPLVNLLIGVLIFLLALSAIDFISLASVFRSGRIQTESCKTSGTFALGMGAGLLSSPCVGPVVVAILLQITTHTGSDISPGLVLASAIKMLFFGLGLGVPFLLIGLFGFTLPKSGRWMRTIQFLLAGLVFYFALTFFRKGILGLGVSPDHAWILISGLLLVMLSAYIFQSIEKTRQERMKKSLGITGIVLGAFLVVFSTLGSLHSESNLTLETSQAPTVERDGNLVWHRDTAYAFELAKSRNQLIFVDFYADWCSNCKAFQELTQENNPLNEALSHSVLLKVYDTDPIFEEFAEDPRFPELQIGLPFFVILTPQGKMIFKTTDYLQTTQMIKHLRYSL